MLETLSNIERFIARNAHLSQKAFIDALKNFCKLDEDSEVEDDVIFVSHESEAIVLLHLLEHLCALLSPENKCRLFYRGALFSDGPVNNLLYALLPPHYWVDWLVCGHRYTQDLVLSYQMEGGTRLIQEMMNQFVAVALSATAFFEAAGDKVKGYSTAAKSYFAYALQSYDAKVLALIQPEFYGHLQTLATSLNNPQLVTFIQTLTGQSESPLDVPFADGRLPEASAIAQADIDKHLAQLAARIFPTWQYPHVFAHLFSLPWEALNSSLTVFHSWLNLIYTYLPKEVESEVLAQTIRDQLNQMGSSEGALVSNILRCYQDKVYFLDCAVFTLLNIGFFSSEAINSLAKADQVKEGVRSFSIASLALTSQRDRASFFARSFNKQDPSLGRFWWTKRGLFFTASPSLSSGSLFILSEIQKLSSQALPAKSPQSSVSGIYAPSASGGQSGGASGSRQGLDGESCEGSEGSSLVLSCGSDSEGSENISPGATSNGGADQPAGAPEELPPPPASMVIGERRDSRSSLST